MEKNENNFSYPPQNLINIDLNTSIINESPEWLHFDDAHVQLLSNNEFNNKIIHSNFDSPYILFYFKATMAYL